MDTVREPARQVPVAAEVDVCVVGGSATGVFAAVAAARLGARVAVIERQGFFGGTATAGLVCVWHTTRDARLERPIIAGLGIEILERLRKRGALLEKPPTRNLACIFNPEELKIELDGLLADAGVRPFLHARFAAPVVEDGEVRAAIIEDKSGRRAVRARVLIDASGDGDLAARAGLECYKDHDLQPPTTCAVIRGLDEIKKRNPDFSLNRAVFEEKHPGALELGFLWSVEMAESPGDRLVAGTRVNGADCSDADQLTRAEMEGRAQVRRIVDLLRANFAGGESVRLSALAAHIGIRQTRQVRCLHQLTEEEVLAGKRFADAIANGSYRVDIHHNDRAGITFRYLDGSEVFCRADGTHRRGRWRPETEEDPTFYQIPYRSLVPRGAGNVLVAGRCLDADRGAFGAVRVMINTNQTGEAAGTAAWLALDSGKPVAEIDTGKLREVMKKQGALII